MVKVSKVAAYQVGDRIYTDRGAAEKAVRCEVLKEVLDATMSFGGIVAVEDVANALTENWGDVLRKMDEAFRGIN